MASPLPENEINSLKLFINICKTNPGILNTPELQFFKEYVESFGGKVPELIKRNTNAEVFSELEESEESELEIDDEGCITPEDDDLEQHMGDSNKEVSEEDLQKSEERKVDAIGYFSDGKYDDAVKAFTLAIMANPGSALLYAKRGHCYLMLNKPNACIKDCSRALTINPDNANAYKFRGRAHRLLGNWVKAAADLRTACKIDFEEQANEWLKEVTPIASKIEAHERKNERKRLEKEVKESRERVRLIREAQKKREEASAAEAKNDTEPTGMGDFLNVMNDPEILLAFQDPEVATAFQDISVNPANILKYQDNTKVASILSKISTKFGGASGFPGFCGSNQPFSNEKDNDVD